MYSCPLCSFRSVPPRITTRERAGHLTLHALGRSLDAPDVTFLGRRQAHLSCRTRAELDVSGGSGRPRRPPRRSTRHRPYRPAAQRRRPVRQGAGPVVLGLDITARTALDDARTGPDVVRFGTCQEDGTFTELAALDGRYLTTEVAGGFTGRVIGPYATDGRVHLRAAHPLTPLAP
ncbi:hypothetical protein [Streptomyces canus]|uniref:hypothetical protein n=1 Tax=Streptomyces canus TaxID=58343 RepID=UPI0027D801E2|nr:hypothetical protein [Streptomyces canus]